MICLPEGITAFLTVFLQMFTALSGISLGGVSMVSLAFFAVIMVTIIRFIMGVVSSDKGGADE